MVSRSGLASKWTERQEVGEVVYLQQSPLRPPKSRLATENTRIATLNLLPTTGFLVNAITLEATGSKTTADEYHAGGTIATSLTKLVRFCGVYTPIEQ